MSIRSTALAALLWAAAGSAHAAVVFGDFVKLAGNVWTAEFKVSNTGSLTEISNFTIFLNPSEGTNLQLLASPATWDSIVIQPDAALPSDGFLDSLVIDPLDALPVGGSISGFKVSFEWLGVATGPTSLDWVISDASFAVLESGTTSTSPVSTVPSPGTIPLLAMGILALFATSRRRLQTMSNQIRTTN